MLFKALQYSIRFIKSLTNSKNMKGKRKGKRTKEDHPETANKSVAKIIVYKINTGQDANTYL